MSENHAKAYVEHMLAAFRHFAKQNVRFQDMCPSYAFLLEHGQEFQGTRWTKFRGRGYRKMELGYCFNNAFLMSLQHPELTYFEGYAHAGLVSAHHAWCVDDLGQVVDFTWRKSVQKMIPEEEWQYFGVGIDTWPLQEWWFARDMASVLIEVSLREDAADLLVAA